MEKKLVRDVIGRTTKGREKREKGGGVDALNGYCFLSMYLI